MEDGKTICDACAATQNLPYNPDEEPVFEAAPEAQTPSFELNNPAEVPVKAKKIKMPKGPKGFPLGGIIAAAVVISAAVAVAVFWSSITSFFVRSFASPEDYMAHVEQKAAEEQINSITNAYGTVLEALGGEQEPGNFAVKSEMHIEVGNDILDMLESAIASSGAQMDLGWLSNIKMSLYANSNGELTESSIGIGLGKTTIATISMLMDMGKGDMYMGIPELSDAFLHVGMGDMGGEMPGWIDMEQIQDNLDEIVAMLPTEKIVNEAMNRYWAIVLENVQDVEKSTDTVEVDGLEQKLNVIECTITEKDILKIAADILKDIQKDEELLKSIYAIAEYTEGYNADEVDELIDMAIEELKDQIEDCDKKNRVELVTYIDNADQIVGRTVKIKSADAPSIEMHYITVWQKDEFAFEAEIADQAVITGSGGREKNLISGRYLIEVQGQKILTLDIDDYDEKIAEDGFISGSFTLTPNEEIVRELVEQMGSTDAMGFLDFTKVSLQFTISTSEKAAEMGMSIKVGGMKILTLTAASEQVEATEVKLPTNIVEVEDQTALMDWVMNMDFEQLIENMEEAGVPEMLIQLVEQAVGQMTPDDAVSGGY